MVLQKESALPKPTGLKLAAAYGCAMSTMFVATEINADILDLTWDGGQAQAVIATSTYRSIDVDQIGDPGAAEFLAANYLFVSSMSNVSFERRAMYAYNISGLNVRPVSGSQTISPGTFTNTSFVRQIPIGTSGSSFIAFRTNIGNVGWFQIQFDTFPGEIRMLGGQVGTEGESLTVGQKGELIGDINCDNQINLADVQPFINVLTSGKFFDKADIDRNGILNLLDIAPFVELLNSG